MTNGRTATNVASKKIPKKSDSDKLQLDHCKIKSLVDKNISAFAIYRIVQTSFNDKLEDNCKKVKINSEFPKGKLKA